MKNITLHNLKYNKGSIKKRKILGRGEGSGHGSKCGKGSNGNKQRSGYRYRPGFEGGQTPLKKKLPMIRRINKFRTDKPKTVTTDMFASMISSGIKEINQQTLSKKRIIKCTDNFKVVFGRKRDLDFKDVTITANGFSENVKIFIESHGGKCIIDEKVKK